MRGMCLALSVVAAASLGGCRACQEQRAEPADEIAHRTHESYVGAINSNDINRLMSVMTDDVVFLPPNEPQIVGKAAVRGWAEPYLAAYTLHWEKTTLEFVVSGQWAFERYAYKQHDVSRSGGDALQDTGKGINIYHRDADGVWRVARDAWSSDLPAAKSP